MITKDTVQYYSKYDIFNQLEIEREKVKELRELIVDMSKHCEGFEFRIKQALNK